MHNIYLKKLPLQGFATTQSSLQQFVQHVYQMQHTSIFFCLSGEALFTIDEETGLAGLNGDLLIWDKVLNRSIELSSMGIRVDKEALLRQLELSGMEERKELYFHKKLLAGELPLCIGGGIGQSRLCMLYLQKAHIGEIQASIWPEDMRRECAEWGMQLI